MKLEYFEYSYIFSDNRGLFDVNASFVQDSFTRWIFSECTAGVVIDTSKRKIEWYVTCGCCCMTKKKAVWMNVNLGEYPIEIDIALNPNDVVGKWNRPFSVRTYNRYGKIENVTDFNKPDVTFVKKQLNRYIFRIVYENEDNRQFS